MKKKEEEGKNVKTDKNICITLTLLLLNLVLIFLPMRKSILLKFSSTVTWSLLLQCRSQGVYRLPTNSWATRDILLAWAIATAPHVITWQGDGDQSILGPYHSALVCMRSCGRHKACGQTRSCLIKNSHPQVGGGDRSSKCVKPTHFYLLIKVC